MLHDQHADAVFAAIASVLDDMAPGPGYRRLFDTAVDAVGAMAARASIFPPVDLSMATADAMGLPLDVAVPAAAACTLLWAGADLMDDAADGQLGEAWQGVPPHQIALVSTNLLATLPHLLVGRVDDGDGSVSASWSQAVSRTLFTMSEGQWTDLQSSRSVTSVDEYLAMVRRKAGAEFALFASAPALLAGADEDTVGAWVRFGFAYGTMSQVFSDTVSTVVDGPRNDLLAGKRTLPVLHTLSVLRGPEHTRFVADLDSAAAGDETAVQRAVEAMTEAEAITASLSRVELARMHAHRELPVQVVSLSPEHPLRRLLTRCRLPAVSPKETTDAEM